MKKIVFGFCAYALLLLVGLILIHNKVYAAAPGTFDCGASGGGMACAVVTHACAPGTKPDESVCRNIGRNIGECNITKDIPCIPDSTPNTADCFLYGNSVCKATNIKCQQGYTESCTGRSRSGCVETDAQCKVADDNTTDCVWYPPSHSCQSTNIHCWSGYAPDCGSRSETDCNVAGVTCRSYDVGPGPTIPVYDPTCSSGTSYYGFSGVKTALGCLPTDPQYFINLATPWAIGIGAGIAFLLGVFGAVMIVLSAGNPEKMQAGKEMITSAIGGLILIIFSVFILRIIGVDILKLFGTD